MCNNFKPQLLSCLLRRGRSSSEGTPIVGRGKASGCDGGCGCKLLYTNLCTQCTWNRTFMCALNGDF